MADNELDKSIEEDTEVLAELELEEDPNGQDAPKKNCSC